MFVDFAARRRHDGCHLLERQRMLHIVCVTQKTHCARAPARARAHPAARRLPEPRTPGRCKWGVMRAGVRRSGWRTRARAQQRCVERWLGPRAIHAARIRQHVRAHAAPPFSVRPQCARAQTMRPTTFPPPAYAAAAFVAAVACCLLAASCCCC